MTAARRTYGGQVAALLAVLAILVPAVVPAQGEAAVRVVKIRYDPPGADDGSNASMNKEWIQNTGEKARTLLGWRIRDADGNVKRLSTELPARTTVKLHSGEGWDSFPHHLYWFADDYVWDNDADTATLRNAKGKVVDRCSYDAPSQNVKVC